MIKRNYFLSYVVRNNGNTRLFGNWEFYTNSWLSNTPNNKEISNNIEHLMFEKKELHEGDVIIITALNRV